jgi:hypothetical protein
LIIIHDINFLSKFLPNGIHVKDNRVTNIVISIFLVSSMPLMAMQEQIVKVHIQVAGDKKINCAHVPIQDVSKQTCFGIMPKLVSETYFPVVAAGYEDTLDAHGCARIQKDLMADIPYSIQQEEVVGKTAREQYALKKRCLFPQHISQSFIDQVKQGKNKHVIYKNGDKTITAHYEIEWLRKEKRAEQIVLPAQKIETRNNYQIPSLFNNGDNFMNIAAVCAFLLFIVV